MKILDRVITFNQKAWYKPYIDINTDLRKAAKRDFERNSMNNSVFWKTMENLKKHREVRLIKSEKRWNYLFSEPNYHTAKFFTENSLTIEIRKTQILISLYS